MQRYSSFLVLSQFTGFLYFVGNASSGTVGTLPDELSPKEVDFAHRQLVQLILQVSYEVKQESFFIRSSF